MIPYVLIDAEHGRHNIDIECLNTLTHLMISSMIVFWCHMSAFEQIKHTVTQ